MTGNWVLYGSTGFTGDLIARLAIQRGQPPLLAGRSREKLKRQAQELGLDYVACGLDDSDALQSLVTRGMVVLNCAGPYKFTAEPIVTACLKRGTHYLDITGETMVFEALARRDEHARSANIVILPGIGFDVAPTDCLAVYLHERLPYANWLRLAIRSKGGSRLSRGTMTTTLVIFSQGNWIWRNGKLVRVPLGSQTRLIDFGSEVRKMALIGLGDASTAYHSTGIPNIENYYALPDSLIRMLPSLERLSSTVGWPFIQSTAGLLIRTQPAGPSLAKRQGSSSEILGEIEDLDGHKVRAVIRGPNAYTWTAITALDAVEKLLAGAVSPGFHTPGTAFGADFILGCDQVSRQELTALGEPDTE